MSKATPIPAATARLAADSQEDVVEPSLTKRPTSESALSKLQRQELQEFQKAACEGSPLIQPHRDLRCDQTFDFSKSKIKDANDVKVAAAKEKGFVTPIRLCCRVAPIVPKPEGGYHTNGTLKAANGDDPDPEGADPDTGAQFVTEWCVEEDNTITIRDATDGTILQTIKDAKHGCIPTAICHAPYIGPLSIPHTDKFNRRPEDIANSMNHEHDFVWIGFNDGSIRLFHASGRPELDDRQKYNSSHDYFVYDLSKHHAGAITCFAVSSDNPAVADLTSFGLDHRTDEKLLCGKDATMPLHQAKKHLKPDPHAMTQYICAGSVDSLISIWSLKDVYSRIAAVRLELHEEKPLTSERLLAITAPPSSNALIPLAAAQAAKPPRPVKEVSTTDLVEQKRSETPTYFERHIYKYFDQDSRPIQTPMWERSTSHHAVIVAKPVTRLKGSGVSGVRTLCWQHSLVVPCPEYQLPRAPPVIMDDGQEEPTSEEPEVKFQLKTQQDRILEDKRDVQMTDEEYIKSVEEAIRHGSRYHFRPKKFYTIEDMKTQSIRVDFLISGDDEGNLTFWRLEDQIGHHFRPVAHHIVRSPGRASEGRASGERSVSPQRPFMPPGPAPSTFAPTVISTIDLPTSQSNKCLKFLGGVAITGVAATLPDTIWYPIPEKPLPPPTDEIIMTPHEDELNADLNLQVSSDEAFFAVWSQLQMFVALSDGSLFQIECIPSGPAEEAQKAAERAEQGRNKGKNQPHEVKTPRNEDYLIEVRDAIDYEKFRITFRMEQVDARSGMVNRAYFDRHNNSIWVSGSDGELIVYHTAVYQLMARIVAKNQSMIMPPTWDEVRKRLADYRNFLKAPRDRDQGTSSRVHFVDFSATSLERYSRYLVQLDEPNEAIVQLTDIPEVQKAIVEKENAIAERMMVTQVFRKARNIEKKQEKELALKWKKTVANRTAKLAEFQQRAMVQFKVVAKLLLTEWCEFVMTRKAERRVQQDRLIFAARDEQREAALQQLQKVVADSAADWSRLQGKLSRNYEVNVSLPKHLQLRWNTLQHFTARKILRTLLFKMSSALGLRATVQVTLVQWNEWAMEKARVRRLAALRQAGVRGFLSGLLQGSRYEFYHRWLKVYLYNKRMRRIKKQQKQFITALERSRQLEVLQCWCSIVQAKKEGRRKSHYKHVIDVNHGDERRLNDRIKAVGPYLPDFAQFKESFLELASQFLEPEQESAKLVLLLESTAVLAKDHFHELNLSPDQSPQEMKGHLDWLEKEIQKKKKRLEEVKNEVAWEDYDRSLLDREMYETATENQEATVLRKLATLRSYIFADHGGWPTKAPTAEPCESKTAALERIIDSIRKLKETVGGENFEEIEQKERNRFETAFDQLLRDSEEWLADDKERIRLIEEDQAANSRWNAEVVRVKDALERRRQEKASRAEERIRRKNAKQERALTRAKNIREGVHALRRDEIIARHELFGSEVTELYTLLSRLTEDKRDAVRSEWDRHNRAEWDERQAQKTAKRAEEDAAHESEERITVDALAKTKHDAETQLKVVDEAIVELDRQIETTLKGQNELEADREAEAEKCKSFDAQLNKREADLTHKETEFAQRREAQNLEHTSRTNTYQDRVTGLNDSYLAQQTRFDEEDVVIADERVAIDHEVNDYIAGERQALEAKAAEAEEAARDAANAAESYGTPEALDANKEKAITDFEHAKHQYAEAGAEQNRRMNEADPAKVRCEEETAHRDALQAEVEKAQETGVDTAELEQRLADANAELLKTRDVLSARSAAVEEQQAVVASKLEAQSAARKAKEDALKAHEDGHSAYRIANQKKEEAASARAAAEAVVPLSEGLLERIAENDAKRQDLEKRRNDARLAHRESVASIESEYLANKPEAAEIPLHDPAIEAERDDIAASLRAEEERRDAVVEEFAKREKTLKDTLETLRPQRAEKAAERTKLEETLVQTAAEQKTLEAELEEAHNQLREARRQADAADDSARNELLSARAREAAQEHAEEDVLAAQQAGLAKEAQQREAAEEIQLFEAEPDVPLQDAEIDGLRSPHNAATDEVETDTEPDPVEDEALRPAPFVAPAEKPLPSVLPDTLDAKMQWVPVPEDSPTGPETYSRWGSQVFDFSAARPVGNKAVEAAAAALADVVIAADFSRQFGYDVAPAQKEEVRICKAILAGSGSELSLDSHGASDDRSMTPTQEGKAPVILRKEHIGPAPAPLDPSDYYLCEADQTRVDNAMYRELLDNLPSLFTIVFGPTRRNPFDPYQDILTPQATDLPPPPAEAPEAGPSDGQAAPAEADAAQEAAPRDEAPPAEVQEASPAPTEDAAPPVAEPAQPEPAQQSESTEQKPIESAEQPANDAPAEAPAAQPASPPEGKATLLETPRQEGAPLEPSGQADSAQQPSSPPEGKTKLLETPRQEGEPAAAPTEGEQQVAQPTAESVEPSTEEPAPDAAPSEQAPSE